MPNFGECRGLCLRGIDIPDHVKEGTIRCIVALERVHDCGPSALSLILRDSLPDGSSRSAIIRKIDHSSVFTLGIEVPLTEAGTHVVELIVAESVGDELAPIFYLPAVTVVVSNPPMPRLMECAAVVLCGVDVCGVRWPLDSGVSIASGSPFRATVALARTWDDAPQVFMMITRCTDSNGAIMAAATRKRISGMLPETLGLEAACNKPGNYRIQVSVLADVSACGEFSEIFVLSPVTVQVLDEAKPAALPLQLAPCAAAPVDAESYVPVALKVSFVDGDRSPVIRRLAFPSGAGPGGALFEDLMAALLSAFRAELPPSAASRLTYVDDEGDEVAISSDAEVADALRLHRAQLARRSGGPSGALRMTLSRA